jgi:hypothetical protein
LSTARRVSTGDVIAFAGHRWRVKDSGGERIGPGPNLFSAENAWVDGHGRLHLAIRQRGSTWTCAEVSTIDPLGTGRNTFRTIGRLDQLDPNVVLGLFLYNRDSPRTAYDEIDIEFSRWGNPEGAPGSFAVYLDREDNPKVERFGVRQSGTHTSHAITTAPDTAESPDRIIWESWHGHGHREGSSLIHGVTYRDYDRSLWQGGIVRTSRSRTHMNLWLFRGAPPAKETEIVIANFRFTPYSQVGPRGR